MPASQCDETAARFDVEVETRGMRILAHLVPELDSHGGLVGTLVLGEAGVPVDAKHRAPDGARVGSEVLAYLPQVRSEVGDEAECGLLDRGLVTPLVVREPDAVVVCLQILEKVEARLREIGPGHDITPS